jgi:hypothetical protein
MLTPDSLTGTSAGSRFATAGILAERLRQASVSSSPLPLDGKPERQYDFR